MTPQPTRPPTPTPDPDPEPTPVPLRPYPNLYHHLTEAERTCLGDEITSQSDLHALANHGRDRPRAISHPAMRCLTDQHRFQFYMLQDPDRTIPPRITESTHRCIWPAYHTVYDTLPDDADTEQFRRHLNDRRMTTLRDTVSLYCLALHQPHHPLLNWSATGSQSLTNRPTDARIALCAIDAAGGVHAWADLLATPDPTSTTATTGSIEQDCRTSIADQHDRRPGPEFYNSLPPDQKDCLGPAISNTKDLLALADPWDMQNTDQPYECLSPDHAFQAFVAHIDDSRHYPEQYHQCYWSAFQHIFTPPVHTAQDDDFYPPVGLLEYAHPYCLAQSAPQHPELPYHDSLPDLPAVQCFIERMGFEQLPLIAPDSLYDNPHLRDQLEQCRKEHLEQSGVFVRTMSSQERFCLPQDVTDQQVFRAYASRYPFARGPIIDCLTSHTKERLFHIPEADPFSVPLTRAAKTCMWRAYQPALQTRWPATDHLAHPDIETVVAIIADMVAQHCIATTLGQHPDRWSFVDSNALSCLIDTHGGLSSWVSAMIEEPTPALAHILYEHADCGRVLLNKAGDTQ